MEVRIVGLPIAMHARAQEQHAELMREFALLDIGGMPSSAGGAVPARLAEVMDDLTHRYGDIGSAPDAHRDAAQARGDETVDLTYQVPPEIGAACEELCALLDEVDQFCRQGDRLLTLAADDDVAAFRHWYLMEITRQLRGESPTSWADYARAHGGAERRQPGEGVA